MPRDQYKPGGVSSAAAVLTTLQERLATYQQARSIALTSGDSTKARRLDRGLQASLFSILFTFCQMSFEIKFMQYCRQCICYVKGMFYTHMYVLLFFGSCSPKENICGQVVKEFWLNFEDWMIPFAACFNLQLNDPFLLCTLQQWLPVLFIGPDSPPPKLSLPVGRSWLPLM